MIHGLKPYPEYKQSGLPWLGAVPSHWRESRLDRLFELRNEVPLPDDQRVTGYLSGRVTLRSNIQGQKIKGVIKDSGWKRVYPGDFAISGMNAHLGGMGVSDSLGKCSPIYLVLKPKPETNAYFVSHAVRHIAHTGALKSFVNTIRFNSADFKRDALKLFRILLPDEGEQVAIVRFLDHAKGQIERAIRAKRKLITLLDEQKQAIIHCAVTRGLDPNVRLKPSGIPWIGDIPEHWEARPLGSITDYISYGFTNPMPATDQGPYMLTATDIAEGKIQYETARRTSNDAFRRLLTDKSRPRVGDLLITKDGTLGRVAIAENTPVCINQSIALLRLTSDGVYREFVAEALQAHGYQEMMSLDAGGTTIKHIYISRLVKMKIVLPPPDEQRAIADNTQRTRSIFENATKIAQREIELLHEYRTRLVAEVVTGKLDVRATARRLPAEREEFLPSLDAEDLTDEAELEPSDGQ